jgi:hypothetical protein
MKQNPRNPRTPADWAHASTVLRRAMIIIALLLAIFVLIIAFAGLQLQT